jgi:putative PIN family toxin of toxin-antitoxin system
VRLVLDTNVVISALLWGGTPHQLLAAAAQGRVELCTCEELCTELLVVLQRPKFVAQLWIANTHAAKLVSIYRAICQLAPIHAPLPKVCHDPKDDVVLACALAAGADLIVSGDNDLLALQTYQTIPILRVNEAIKHIHSLP